MIEGNMAAIEVTTFRLTDPEDTERFIIADAAMQEWSYLHVPGIQRRTVARSGDQTWIVIVLFDSIERCNEATNAVEQGEIPSTWQRFIDASSIVRQSYSLL